MIQSPFSGYESIMRIHNTDRWYELMIRTHTTNPLYETMIRTHVTSPYFSKPVWKVVSYFSNPVWKVATTFQTGLEKYFTRIHDTSPSTFLKPFEKNYFSNPVWKVAPKCTPLQPQHVLSDPRRCGSPSEPFSKRFAAIPLYRIPSTHFKTPLEPSHCYSNTVREKDSHTSLSQ